MAAIYSTVEDLLDAAVEVVLPLKGVSGNRALMLVWLNLGQLEIQRLRAGRGYETLRTVRSLTMTTTRAYDLTAGDWAVDRETFRDSEGTKIIYRTEEEIRRNLDGGWDDTGTVSRFTQKAGQIWLWKIPTAAAITDQSPITYDAFARFDGFTAEADTLGQYRELDRIVLLQYLIYRGMVEDDDPSADRALKIFEAMVDAMDTEEGFGDLIQIGLGPYFDETVAAETDEW